MNVKPTQTNVPYVWSILQNALYNKCCKVVLWGKKWTTKWKPQIVTRAVATKFDSFLHNGNMKLRQFG